MVDGGAINWVGHCRQGTSDKVWGWLTLTDGRSYAFWGRRGKKLRFKLHENRYDAYRLQDSKESKGYQFIHPDQYDRLVKDFIEEVSIWCTTAILGDTVM